MVTISRAEYESLKAERDELNQKLDWLLEQVRLNRKKLYGVSSERLLFNNHTTGSIIISID